MQSRNVPVDLDDTLKAELKAREDNAT